MAMIYRILLSYLFGLFLHITYRPTLSFGVRWSGLLQKAIGGLGLIPVRALMWHGVEEVDIKDRFIITELLSLVSFGAGVFTGHLLDKD